jgi:hypothetical protein
MMDGSQRAGRMFAWLAWMVAGPLFGQNADTLKQVKTVYVEPFGNKPGCEEMRASVVSRLRRSRGIEVVSDAGHADAVLSGSGEMWIKGYYSLNPRVRSVSSDAHAIYGGYLSVELKGRHNEVLWSYLVTPHRGGAGELARNLADQMVKQMGVAISGTAKPAGAVP